MRELTDPAPTHDVGARVPHVEGQPVGALGGVQHHEARQRRARRAHRIVGGSQRRHRGGRGVDRDGQIHQIHRPIPEPARAEVLLEDQDRRRRGLRPAQVPTHAVGDRKDGWDSQPRVLVFRSDRANVGRGTPSNRGALRMFIESHLPSSFPLRNSRSVTHYVHHSTHGACEARSI